MNFQEPNQALRRHIATVPAIMKFVNSFVQSVLIIVGVGVAGPA